MDGKNSEHISMYYILCRFHFVGKDGYYSLQNRICHLQEFHMSNQLYIQSKIFLVRMLNNLKVYLF